MSLPRLVLGFAVTSNQQRGVAMHVFPSSTLSSKHGYLWLQDSVGHNAKLPASKWSSNQRVTSLWVCAFFRETLGRLRAPLKCKHYKFNWSFILCTLNSKYWEWGKTSPEKNPLKAFSACYAFNWGVLSCWRWWSEGRNVHSAKCWQLKMVHLSIFEHQQWPSPKIYGSFCDRSDVRRIEGLMAIRQLWLQTGLFKAGY